MIAPARRLICAVAFPAPQVPGIGLAAVSVAAASAMQ
jgi:hypothetical protein